MRDNIIEYKVKIFISSLCGNKYSLVRKALKLLLLETNLTLIYEFETTEASSQYVTQSYLSKLDDSDLCIFLIDNMDGASESVIREQKRARELKIKSIYLFCDENQKEPTQIQKEIIESSLEKFTIVHEFSDFINCGYQSILRDIVDIYRNYCKNRGQVNVKSEDELDLKVLQSNLFVFNKKLVKGFNATKNVLLNIIDSHEREIKETSDFDKLCTKLLNIVLGNATIDSFDFCLLEALIPQIHEETFSNIILTRYKALNAYFNNKIDECYTLLNIAYNETVTNHSIPSWIKLDILLDMRNIHHLIDEMKSQHTIESNPQRLLNENNEILYYPVIDRLESEFHDEVLKLCYDDMVCDPYTTIYSGTETIFNNIASIFIISVYNGSLTHMLFVRDRIINTLKSICLINNNHSMYIELVKNYVICQRDKELDKFIRAYNQTTDMINADDICKIIQAIKAIPIQHKRSISYLVLFKHFGYYLSDKQFTTISEEIMENVNEWVTNNNRIYSISGIIFKSFKANSRRLDNNFIVDFILKVFTYNLKRWFNDAIDLIGSIDFGLISIELIENTIKHLLKLIANEEDRSNCPSLQNAIIFVRKNTVIMSKEIDEYVKTYMGLFYDGNYSLEVFNLDETTIWQQINRFIQTIHNQNKEQGTNGIYYGWGENPYLTIKNILKYDKPVLDNEKIILILNAIEETVLSQRQRITDKIHAIQLLIYLNNNSAFKKELHDVFHHWLSLETDIMCGFESDVFNKESIETLKFNFQMLKISFGEYEKSDLLANISALVQFTDYEIIKTMECLNVLLFNNDFNLLDESTLAIITQYIIGMSSHKETDVRYYVVHILFLLCKTSFGNLVLSQLSKMMDHDNYMIKANILNQLRDFGEENNEITKLIKQKGLVDNHYLVRRVAGMNTQIGVP